MYFKDTILQEAEIKALKPSKNKQYEFKSCVNKVIAKLGFAATDHKFTNGSKFKFKGYSATVLAEDMKKQASKIDKEHTNAFKSIGCKEIDVKLGKAGHKRWLGIRPTVRGMAMNPVDHPLGGGEGAGKGHVPVTPWGQPCRGYKTRNKRKTSSRFIVSRRKK